MPTLNWIGKDKVVSHASSVPLRTLEHKYTFGEDGTGNMIIHGDNLAALKALLPKYEGKIKCIYIDPPYNTGNEGWVYNDNVNAPQIRKWLGEVVGKEGEDLSRHDKWLCMMYPRLQLLRRLLSDDGAIFISIDDNEQANLKLVADEIMGGVNYIACLPTIMNLKGNQDEFGFAGTHEYTVVYAKNKSNLIIKEFPISNEEFAGWSEDEIGYYKKGANLKATGVNAPRTKRPFLYYPILVHVQSLEVSTISKEEFSKIYDPSKKSFNDSYVDELKKMYEERGYAFLLPLTDNQGMSWRWGRDKVENESHEIIVVGDNGSYSLYKKQRPEVGELPTKKPKTLFYKPEYSSGNGTTMLKAIFGDKVFQNPKPVDLIFDFLQISSDSPSLILDSFAGSGTTAHAVLNLNKKDGGKRKFILIEMEEYAESITAERVKRVINGYGEGKGVVEGTGGGFDYYELGERYFDEAGNLNEDLGIERIREYIWYSETGNNGDRICSAIDYYLGRNKNTDYYFYYEREEITTLTEETLRQMLRQRAEQYVVYADICMMSEELLRARNVVFKKIPRDIKKM